MHKLVILIEAIDGWDRLEMQWPGFLHLVESLPGLRRESSSRIERFLYGRTAYGRMHELFFDSLAEAEQALMTPRGQEAGRMLQQMSGGRVVLFFAEHKEDTAENIQKYRQADDHSG
jgi:hypothetical protein